MWSSTAAALARLGWPVSVVPGRPTTRRSPDEVLEHLLVHLPADRPLVLVVHSNAGLYVPALGSRRQMIGSVFVDAALPPAVGDVPMAPPAMHAVLQDMADAEGLLPPWSRWAEEEVRSLFPDASAREAGEAQQPRLPL